MDKSVDEAAGIGNTYELSKLRWVQIEVPVPRLE